MTQSDWKIFNEDFNIKIKGEDVPKPLRFWNESGLPTKIVDHLENGMGFKEPSAIQRGAIPIGMQYRDIIGVAETGSGKTAAFVLPMLLYIHQKCPLEMIKNIPEEGPLCIVLAPTRELAQQIREETLKLSEPIGVKVACMIGGQAKEEQLRELRNGAHILVGTPGRIVEMLESRYLVLNQCKYVVLDEADRMIDMGFEPEVTKIMNYMHGGEIEDEDEFAPVNLSLPKPKRKANINFTRTTIMFTATMPPSIINIGKMYMRDPVVVKIGDESSGLNMRISHDVRYITEKQKKSQIKDVLRRGVTPALVFVNVKKNCDMVARGLNQQGFSCCVFTGGRSQEERESTLSSFREGRFKIMVCTDVAARGLDIPDVAMVVNYDLPASFDRFVHRVGRTGRAGKSGKACTFVTEHDEGVFKPLKDYLAAVGARSAIPKELAESTFM
eukprot:TRINITY_DN2346_c0_g3_i2.p1 TRINITY_DN2346_c0_g3~~TRINITY_DN2346_c0_g3_i2.p1  ORF type:complete len:442 (+),score=181.44 TRINITY_DN2346_c0_g3_i2:1170-2495(+)